MENEAVISAAAQTAEVNVSEERTKKIKKYIMNWLKDPYNKVFLAIFIIAVAVRIYFLDITISQPVWWDAADYLTEAKVLAGKLAIPYFFTPRRTFLLPLLWAGLLKLGFGEISFRILEFLFSVISVPAMYMIGKKMFDKKIALMSSFLLAVFWMHLFYSNRLMTEVPSLAFLLFSLYFFWEAYTKKNEKMYIWWGIFLGLAFLTRAGTFVMFAVFPLFLLITEKTKVFKNKYLWLGALCTAGLMASFFIFSSVKQHLNAVAYFLALTPDTVPGGLTRLQGLMGFSGIGEYAALMPHYFGTVLLILFGLGVLLFLFHTLVGFDIIMKRKSAAYDKFLLILLFALVPFIFQALFYNHSEDRYLMNAFPAFFIMLAFGLSKVEGALKKYNKYIGTFLIITLLIVGAYWQLSYGNLIITGKASSYSQIEEAGLWIKANSDLSSIIVTRSVPQTTYYAERQVFDVPTSDNQTDFEKMIADSKPDYLELSLFESYPDWLIQQKNSDSQMAIVLPYFSSSIVIDSSGKITSADIRQSVQKGNVKYTYVYPENSVTGAFVYKLTYT
jgi:hypothetical protein